MTLYHPCPSQMPLDVNALVQIFSFLETKDKQNAAQVCQYWRDVVYIPSLWTNVRVVLYNKLSASLVRSLCQRGINRFVCRSSTDEDLALLFKTNCHITSLKIERSCRYVTQQFLQNNLGKLNELVSLHIEYRIEHGWNGSLSLCGDGSLDNVLARLKSFTIPGCFNSSSELQEILQKCPSLEEIHRHFPLGCFCESPEVLPKSCPNLQRLKVGYLWFNHEDKDRWKASLNLLNLKSLDLDEDWNEVNRQVREIIDMFDHNLEALSLRAQIKPHSTYIPTPMISVDTLVFVVKKYDNLKHLVIDVSLDEHDFHENKRELCYEISKLTKMESLSLYFKDGILGGEEIYNLTERMPKLKKLEIGEVGNISAEYADLIGDQLPKLRSLKITAKQNAEGTGIGILCSKLSNLTALTIKHDGLLNRDVIQMSTNARCNGLKSLNIAGSKKIKDDGIKCIANTFKSLTSLDASSCSLSDSGLAVITEQLNHLQSLSVTGKKITNYGAIMIGKHLKGLEHLKISGSKIGDQGFAFICNQLPRLQTLEAICKLVTGQGFQEGAQWLGGLKTLRIGSHGIPNKEFAESVQHLKSVVELTIRSIPIDEHCVNEMVKEMPCLAKLVIFYCCSSSHVDIRRHFSLCNYIRKCFKRKIIPYEYCYPCREHAFALKQYKKRSYSRPDICMNNSPGYSSSLIAGCRLRQHFKSAF